MYKFNSIGLTHGKSILIKKICLSHNIFQNNLKYTYVHIFHYVLKTSMNRLGSLFNGFNGQIERFRFSTKAPL